MTQYFHVDESGDPGIHSLKGVPYFVLAMAQLPDREPIANFQIYATIYMYPKPSSFIITR
jgi:hypothetical protein